MALTCSTCGTAGDADNRIVRLVQLPPRHEDDAGPLLLCRSCLAERRSREWSMERERGKRLHEALEDRNAPHDGRFTYFRAREDRTVQLVRLRPRWVAEHRETSDEAEGTRQGP